MASQVAALIHTKDTKVSAAYPPPQAPAPRQSISANTAKRVHREVRFGAYILGSTLGEGEFGKVKLGWRKDGKLPSQVAIKLIKRDTIMKDSESEIKIHREINSLKLLNHPNIVNLVEVMKSGKYIGIVLEYASGGELFDYILHHKYLKENVAKKLFAQLVSGVDYMHSKGLIHRDLKLENLLLDKHKNVIVSDFGFVNSYNRDKNDLMKTSCGSPCYAAPELVLTQSPYEGRKVDIWSLGVILYAMLSGYLPFDDDPENEDGSDIVRLYHYICKTPLTFPEYVSPLARDLLRKIIVPDPKKRITMNEIRNHPWLSPHANLLSIRQPEWDRIHKEKDVAVNVQSQQYNQNKRFSMIDAKTSSSSLLINSTPSLSAGNGGNINGHSRSYSSTSITQLYSSPSTSSSLANAIALPKTAAPTNSASESRESTPSPTKPFVRGHAKSASVSNTYSTASYALKAVVDDNKRNSVTSLDSLAQPIFPPPSTKANFHYASNPNSRTSTYTGTPISTIVESPTKKVDIPAISNFVPLLPPSRNSENSSSRESNRLPHSTKKPRPTSYHPSSMTSSFMSNGNASSSALLDYIKIPSPINLPIPQFLSSSPTRSHDSADGILRSQNSSPTGKDTTHPSRRNSVVTHVHVNGVLSDSTSNSNSPEHPNKRNSVLSYLEDKMDVLDLNEVHHSPTRVNTTPQINQAPVFDSQSTSPDLEKPGTVAEVPIVGEVVIDKSKIDGSVEKMQEKSLETVSTLGKLEEPPKVQKAEVKRSRTAPKSSRESRDFSRENKENKEVKEQKKRNRFSWVSLYSSYNVAIGSENNNINTNTTAPSTQSQLSPASSSSSKKILEPSSDINVPTKTKDQKRIHSSSSAHSKKSATSTATGSSSANGKEASAARKVMDFFKRRSVRIG